MQESAVVMVENDRVRVFGKKIELLPPDDTRAGIVLALRRSPDGMTASHLAKQLGVSQTMVAKAADKLRLLGIVRKEPLKLAKNVKIYFLATRIIDDKEIAEIRKRVPPMLQELMKQKFKNQEEVGLVFADQVMKFINSLDPSDRPGVFSEYIRLAKEKGHDENNI